MSRRDYTKFSKETKPVEVETPVVQEVVEESVEVKPAEPIIGMVTNCTKLNVRVEPKPNAEVLCILDRNSELTIDEDESTDAYYKICTAAGIEGYCVKFYVKVKP